MQASAETITKIREQLRADASLPPKRAVLAFLSLANSEDPIPRVFVEWHGEDRNHGLTWTILSLEPKGLVVVIASSPSSWTWRDPADPDDAKLSASFVPYSSGAGVSLTDVEEWHNFDMESGMRGRCGWIIELVDRENITLPDLAFEGDASGEQVCRSLMERLG